MAITDYQPDEMLDENGELSADAPIHLLQLRDDLARSRQREAFWISLVVHMVLLILFITAPRYLPVSRTAVPLNSAEELLRNRDLTFLEMPADAMKPHVRPNTDVASDKDRIAMSRRPDPAHKLETPRDVRRPGAPGAGAAQQMAQASPPPQQGQQAQRPQQQPQPRPPDTGMTAKLETPASAAPRQIFGGGTMSAGTAIEQAARAAAQSRGGGGGDYGLGQGNRNGAVGPMDILSDTMGVDFGPYLARVLHDVRENWYQIIPEVARPPLMKRGKVSIEFAILKNGRVAGLRIVSPSGDVSLDRAAYGGISGSNPFPPLPNEFKGDYLALRFHFFYNPDKHDLE